MNRENMQREFKVTAGEQKRILFTIQKKKGKGKKRKKDGGEKRVNETAIRPDLL